MEQTKTISVDGETYEIERFSPAIQQAVNIYNVFQADLQRDQMAVIKSQAALQAVGAQITEAVKAELEAQKKAPTEQAAEVKKPAAKSKKSK